MPKAQIRSTEIKRIISLRRTGHSLPEIQKIVKRGNSTIFKYIQGVSIPPKYQRLLKSKQGGSRSRSKKDWEAAYIKAKRLLGDISTKDLLIILTCLYWGE